MKNLIVVLLVLICHSAGAAEAYLRAKVTRVFQDSDEFGGCMAYLEPGPETKLVACDDDWITFSCTGDFNSKSAGNAKLSIAQAAMVVEREVVVRITDQQKHNGYCFAERIDQTTSPITP